MKIQLTENTLTINLNNWLEIFGEEIPTDTYNVTFEGDEYVRVERCGDYYTYQKKD